MKANCEAEKQLTFPETVPVFYILAKESTDSDPYWEGYHRDMVNNNEKGKVEIIEGIHYVHLSNKEKVIELTRDLLEINKRIIDCENNDFAENTKNEIDDFAENE